MVAKTMDCFRRFERHGYITEVPGALVASMRETDMLMCQFDRCPWPLRRFHAPNWMLMCQRDMSNTRLEARTSASEAALSRASSWGVNRSADHHRSASSSRRTLSAPKLGISQCRQAASACVLQA